MRRSIESWFPRLTLVRKLTAISTAAAAATLALDEAAYPAAALQRMEGAGAYAG